MWGRLGGGVDQKKGMHGGLGGWGGGGGGGGWGGGGGGLGGWGCLKKQKQSFVGSAKLGACD